MGNRAAQFVAACLICAVGAEDGGGWSLPADLSLGDEGTCTIEVLDGSELSHQQFIERYAFSRPVVLRGLTNNTKFQHLCSKSSLLEKYGSLKVRLSTANTHSYRKVDVLLQEYVDEFLRPQSEDALGSETLYFFGDNNFTEWQNLFDQYESPPYVLPDTTGAYSFGIAGPGTGVPFHWHGPGYSEVIYGRKRWFLYPPEKEPHFHPNRTTLSWVTETYPYLPEEEAPLECTIRPGETAGGMPPSTWTPVSSSPPFWAELHLQGIS
ncbi:jmjC domain-containing protein 8-like isoform X1 [Girardinichthys multiradiatus]|uniref:jmjC domain-containing protein 8-like isoform X1 n=1 Tax=Girardinichthys multiradiatus TaxID=208333 RepID=UPI001FAD54F1|nr:jmjC domain-containing protein 8-like isoform X1 [Girardinichthys multiradiatus]